MTLLLALLLSATQVEIAPPEDRAPEAVALLQEGVAPTESAAPAEQAFPEAPTAPVESSAPEPAPLAAPPAAAPAAAPPVPAAPTATTAASSLTLKAPEPLAEPPLLLVANPTFSMESGAVSLIALRQLAFMHDAPMRRWIPHGDGGLMQRAAGMAARALKYVFIDAPLISFGDTVLHEAYGHGARARESGARPYYELELPWPYRTLSSRRGIAGLTYGAYTGNPELDTQMVAAGIEAEYLQAHEVNLQMMQRGGRAPYWELMAYVDLKLAYSTVLLFQDLRVPTPAAGDPDQYLEQLGVQFNRWRPADRAALAHGLQRAYLWNFLDPTFAVALYRLGVSYFIFGETDLAVPTLSVGDVRLWPGTRFNLSPFGPEVMAELFAARREAAGALTVRTGVGGVANTLGLSARVVGVSIQPWLSLGADADAWLQPVLLFQERYAFVRPGEFGGRIALSAQARVLGRLGATAKLALKSRGYVPGQPLAEGLSGFVGLVLWPDAGGTPLFQITRP